MKRRVLFQTFGEKRVELKKLQDKLKIIERAGVLEKPKRFTVNWTKKRLKTLSDYRQYKYDSASQELKEIDPRQHPSNPGHWLSLVVKEKKKKAFSHDPTRPWTITDKQAALIITSACHYCGFKGEINEMGIDRKDSLLGYVPRNCLPCCITCNFAKRNLPYDTFLDWVKRLTTYQHAEQQTKTKT